MYAQKVPKSQNWQKMTTQDAWGQAKLHSSARKNMAIFGYSQKLSIFYLRIGNHLK
jgi:hypothetical protein